MNTDFLRAVKLMRQAQRQYNKYCDRVSLEWVKDTEKEVDKMIYAYEHPTLL